MNDSEFNTACSYINEYHDLDPAKVEMDGREVSSERLYAQRMAEMLDRYTDQPTYELRLAALCHHIKRWEILRSEYPMDRQGYFNWRRQVSKHQLNVTEEVLSKANVSASTVQQVLQYLKKENLKRLPEAQIIEDVGCLVFIQHYLESFAQPHEASKVVDIIYKTMLKMSQAAIDTVSSLSLSDQVLDYIGKAMILRSSNQ